MWVNELSDHKRIKKVSERDQLMTMTPMEATRKLMNSKLKKDTDYKLLKDYFMVDYNLMDCFVFENYLHRPKKKDEDFLEQADLCLESIKLGDYTGNLMGEQQNYNLLMDFVYFAGIRPSLGMDRFIDFPQFP